MKKIISAVVLLVIMFSNSAKAENYDDFVSQVKTSVSDSAIKRDLSVPSVDDIYRATRRVEAVNFKKLATKTDARRIAEDVVREHQRKDGAHGGILVRKLPKRHVRHLSVRNRKHHRLAKKPTMAVKIKEVQHTAKANVKAIAEETEANIFPLSFLGAMLVLLALLGILLVKRKTASEPLPAAATPNSRRRAGLYIHPGRRDARAGQDAYRGQDLSE